MSSTSIILLIDGNSLVHRAFHAITDLTTSQGEQVNAVYGFSMILLNVIKKFEPKYAAVAFDLHAPTFRHVEYKEYKATRPETDAALIPQFDRVREVVRAFNIPIFEIEGYEADDVLGTLARQVHECTHDGSCGLLQSVIVTGDLDALQLVDDNTRVYTSKRQLTDEVIYDANAVKERYGFGPEFVVDYKALRGDPSDNIPGVKGIGEKTATQLILELGHLEEIYEKVAESSVISHQSSVKPRTIELLKEYREDAFLSKHLATIVREVPITLDLPGCELADYDPQAVKQLFQQLEFRSLLAKLPDSNHVASAAEIAGQPAGVGQMSLFSLPGVPVELPPVERPSGSPDCQVTLVRSLDELDDFIKQVNQNKLLVFDTETDSLDTMQAKLVGLALAADQDQGFYLPIGHGSGSNLDWDDCRARLEPLFTDPAIRKVGHNLKFDALILKNHGITVRGLYFDTLLAAYLLHPGLRAYGLKDLAFTELGWEMTRIEELIGSKRQGQISFAEVDPEQAAQYASMDVISTFALYQLFLKRLGETTRHLQQSQPDSNMEQLFFTIEMPLVEVLVDMEFAGIELDEDFLARMSVQLNDEIKVQENEIINIAGHYFNVNSTQQLSKVLFDELGIKKTVKRKTGYATDADSLEKIRDVHPIIERILSYRELVKLQSTYVEALPPLVCPRTHRIHTSFNQAVTATGRLSSSNPNLQNIPVRTELGREIRKAFRAADGCQLLAADYSQVEFRILAHMANDQMMIDAFHAGEDFHTSTAAKIFNVYPEQVTEEQRRSAKTVNFGVIYGQSKYGLAKQLGISQEEAEAFIQAFFSNFPEVAAYLEKTRLEARAKGYVSTLFGRIRQIPEINSPSPMQQQMAERMAINMPIQGTAADIMKIAMIALWKELGVRYSGSQSSPHLLLQVHDEVVVEVPDGLGQDVAALVTQKMEQVYELAVPLKVDVKIGKNWGEME